MRLARKLFLLATTTLAVLALTATANAQGPVDVFNEETDILCTAVNVDSDHNATNGCHVEYEAEEHIPLVAHTPTGQVILSSCNVHLEARISGTGGGFVTQMALTDENPPANPPCTRTPCDEAAPSHKDLLWPLQIEENAAGQESVEVEFCLRTANGFGGVEGGTQSRCRVHLPFTSDVDHNHEIGTGGEYFCEVSPAAVPISIQDAHFVNEVPAEIGTEDIFLVH